MNEATTTTVTEYEYDSAGRVVKMTTTTTHRPASPQYGYLYNKVYPSPYAAPSSF